MEATTLVRPDVPAGLESLKDDLAGKASGNVSMDRVEPISAPRAATGLEDASSSAPHGGFAAAEQQHSNTHPLGEDLIPHVTRRSLPATTLRAILVPQIRWVESNNRRFRIVGITFSLMNIRDARVAGLKSTEVVEMRKARNRGWSEIAGAIITPANAVEPAEPRPRSDPSLEENWDCSTPGVPSPICWLRSVSPRTGRASRDVPGRL